MSFEILITIRLPFYQSIYQSIYISTYLSTKDFAIYLFILLIHQYISLFRKRMGKINLEKQYFNHFFVNEKINVMTTSFISTYYCR